MTSFKIASLLWRRGGARQWTVLGLTAAGVVAATALALLALSVSPGIGARGDRITWQEPTIVADGETATALQRQSSDYFRGQEITRIDVAATGEGTPPVPPGLDALPGVGEIAVTPALARLLESEPPAALADRYPGEIVATIGPEGRAGEDDLAAVVGREPADIEERATPINSFATSGRSMQVYDYQVMSQMAAVLLVVPTVLLVGALARLTAAQREQRLAALRLAGATPGLVVAVTAIETALAGLVGAIGGVLFYLAILPSAARIELMGEPFTASELRLDTWVFALTLLVVPALAAFSATLALRKVVIGPLGVSARVQGRRPRLIRLVSIPAAWILLALASGAMADGGGIAIVLLGLGAVIGTLAVVGPLLTWVVGFLMARLGRRPAPLIAGRRIVDDARGTYRTVSGMVLAGLIAGFLFGVLPTIQHADEVVDTASEDIDLTMWVPVRDADAVTAAVRGVGSEVTWDEESYMGDEEVDPDLYELRGDVTISDGVDVEEVRTAVLASSPESWVSSYSDFGASTRQLVDDMGRASIVMSLAALAMATVATAIGSTASIIDQRVTLARLRLAGTSIGALQTARRWQAVVPLGLAGIGAMTSGAIAAQMLMVAAGANSDSLRPPAFAPMAGLGLMALLAGAAAVAATRPVLVTATRGTPRD